LKIYTKFILNLPKQLTTVTTFSKVLAVILFIVLSVCGFYLGMQYQKIVNESAWLEYSVISQPVQDLPDTEEIFIPSVLLSNPGSYINKIVKVQAIVIPKDTACTLRACGQGVACCNTCGGGLSLSDPSGGSNTAASSSEGSIRLIGENVKCSGMDCDIKCTPLEKGETYIVTGKLVEKTKTGGKTYYELEYISHEWTISQITPPPTTLDPEKGKYCQTLDEKQCYESTECIPSYGPSCPICEDIRYSGCVYSSTKTDNKILCANTGGVWDSAWNQEDRYSRYKCECPIPEGVSPYDVVFSTDKGCVAPTPLAPSMRDICEKNGGYWNAKSECENIDATACIEMKGNYNNCASPCRYAARKESCEKINNYCVQLCTIK